MPSTRAAADLVTVDSSTVSPKVRNGSVVALAAAFVGSYVLGQLGQWSALTSFGKDTTDLVGSALIALFSAVIAFTVGYFTAHGKTLLRDVVQVIGPDNFAVIRSDLKAAFGELEGVGRLRSSGRPGERRPPSPSDRRLLPGPPRGRTPHLLLQPARPVRRAGHVKGSVRSSAAP